MKPLIFFLIRKFLCSPKKIWLCVLIFFLNLFTLQFILSSKIPSYAEFTPTTEVVYSVCNIQEYRENCLLTAKNAQKILDGGFSEKDSDYIYNTAVFNLYTNLADEVTSVSSVDNCYFDYSYSILYLILFCFILTASLFGDDVDSGMQMLTWSVKHGRRQLAHAKLTVLLCGITVAVFLSDGIGLTISGGIPLSTSVQSLPGMALCPLKITILEYFFLSCFLKILLLFCLSCIAASVYILLRHVTYSALIVVLTCGISYALSLLKTDSIYHLVNYISPYSIALVSPMFSRYRMIALFDGTIHITSWKFQIFVLSVSTFLFAKLLIAVLCRYRPKCAVLFFKQKHSTKKVKEVTPRNLSGTGMSLSLFRHEVYKLTASGGSLVLLTAFIITLVLPYTENRETHYTERIYRNYVESYSGETVEDAQWNHLKAANVEYEADRLEYETVLLQSADGQFAAGEITSEEYTEILNLYGGSEIKAQILKNVMEYSDYLSLKSGKYDVGMVYDTGWNEFFTDSPDFLLYLAIAFLSSGLFSIEYGYESIGGMADIIKTTISGRRCLFYKKMIVSVTLGLLFGIFSETVRIVFLLSQYKLPLAGLPVQSLMIFSNCNMSLTIAATAVISVLLRILAMICFSVFICVLSVLLKAKLPSMILSVIAVLISAITDSGNIICPITFMAGNLAEKNTIITVGIFFGITVCFILFGYWKWKGAFHNE